MKGPDIIIYNKKRWYKKIISYKYNTKPLYGYKGSYISYDSGYKETLFEIVELSEWLIEKNMYNFLKNRGYI